MRKSRVKNDKQVSRVPMLLRQLLTAEEAEKTELKKTIISLLKDPGEITRCGILDSAHPLYLNAQIVDDAFESVTNGMEDPALLQSLQTIPDDSLVGPWKRCVMAIKALYGGDLAALKTHREKIPENTPPRRLADLVLQVISAEGKALNEEGTAGRFISELLQSPDYVGAAGEQMEEALEMGMTELFADTAVMLLRDIEREYPEQAPDFAVWCFSRLAAEDQSLMSLLRRFKPLFGEPETLRLAALGVLDEDADAALFFWLKFITADLAENSPDSESLAAALLIAAEISEGGTVFAAEEEPEEHSPEDELLRQQFSKLLSGLQASITAGFPASADIELLTPGDCRRAALLLNPETDQPEIPDNTFSRERTQKPKENRDPQQLELFA